VIKRLNLGAGLSLTMPSRAVPIRIAIVHVCPDATGVAGSVLMTVRDGAGNVAFEAEALANVPQGVQFAAGATDIGSGGNLPPDLWITPEDTVTFTSSFLPAAPTIVTYFEAEE